MDWISSIRSCVREAEWNRDEDLREQAQSQLSMIQHDMPSQQLAPPRVVPISIPIPQLSDNDRIAAMVRGSQMFKFGYSRGSLEQRLVQLSGDRSELIWREATIESYAGGCEGGALWCRQLGVLHSSQQAAVQL